MMQSLAILGSSRLFSRAIAGGVASDSYKDGVSTVPKGPILAVVSSSSRSDRGQYSGFNSIFTTAYPLRKALYSARLFSSSSASTVSPSFAQDRLFQRLLTELLPHPPSTLPLQTHRYCTAAASAAAASSAATVKHHPVSEESRESSTQEHQQRRLALKLITAQCGFSKDNIPSPSALRAGSGSGRGFMASMRRRLRMEQRADRGRDAQPTEEQTDENGAPTLPPTAGRAACFGDDSFFVTGDSAADVLGVADGVGGWRNYGVDPSLFSSSLMATCQNAVIEGRSRPEAPKTIIATGYHDLIQRTRTSFSTGRSRRDGAASSGLLGSSTVCIVSFHRDTQNLYAANLGDSGFAVYRNGKVIHRSTEQQHYFNTPYQLSLPPQPASGSNSSMLQDSPEVADASSVSLEEGDIIVLATDGLWDNLDDEMIWEEIDANLEDTNDEESLRLTARALARRARALAFDRSYMSPFAKNARAAGIQRVQGGKPDDITILLSAVAQR